jgi:broad specificity phosphatase PhoE
MSQSSMKPQRKTIYLTRHGETDYNRRMIVQGSGIDSDLNETGLWQAQRLFEAYQHIPFEAVYVSQLKRTHQTMTHFIEKFGNKKILPELNEIHWGILEGQDPTPERYQHFLDVSALWKNGNYEVCVDKGETPAHLLERQKIGLQKIMMDPFETVIVCMHGRAIRSFLCLLTGNPLSEMDSFPHENTGMYVLQHKQDYQFEIVQFNQTHHLIPA